MRANRIHEAFCVKLEVEAPFLAAVHRSSQGAIRRSRLTRLGAAIGSEFNIQYYKAAACAARQHAAAGNPSLVWKRLRGGQFVLDDRVCFPLVDLNGTKGRDARLGLRRVQI